MLNIGSGETADQFGKRNRKVRQDEHIVPGLNFCTYISNDSRKLPFPIEPDFVVGKGHVSSIKAGAGTRRSPKWLFNRRALFGEKFWTLWSDVQTVFQTHSKFTV